MHHYFGIFVFTAILATAVVCSAKKKPPLCNVGEMIRGADGFIYECVQINGTISYRPVVNCTDENGKEHKYGEIWNSSRFQWQCVFDSGKAYPNATKCFVRISDNEVLAILPDAVGKSKNGSTYFCQPNDEGKCTVVQIVGTATCKLKNGKELQIKQKSAQNNIEYTCDVSSEGKVFIYPSGCQPGLGKVMLVGEIRELSYGTASNCTWEFVIRQLTDEEYQKWKKSENRGEIHPLPPNGGTGPRPQPLPGRR